MDHGLLGMGAEDNAPAGNAPLQVQHPTPQPHQPAPIPGPEALAQPVSTHGKPEQKSEESQIYDHVTGHADANEFERLKDVKPRSLGERVKMEAMKSQRSKAAGAK
jgi:hypothetical protein